MAITTAHPGITDYIMLSTVCAGYMAIIVLAMRNKLPQPAEATAVAANCAVIALVAAILLPRGWRIYKEYGRTYIITHFVFLVILSLILGIWTLALPIR